MPDGKKLTDAERAFEEFIAKGIPKPKPKRKANLAEVSPRMHAAVKAKPDKLRMVAEDEHGNAVIDRPYRPHNPLARGEYSENLKVPEEPKAEPIPDNIPLLELAEMVVRGKVKLSPPQQRMLIEMLPYVAPKLATVALAHIEEFASKLDRAIEASNRAKHIEAKAVEIDSD